MKSVRLVFFITIIFFSLITSQNSVKSLSITEFEGTNYLQIFRELSKQYYNHPKSLVEPQADGDGLSSEEFETFASTINSLENTCQSFSSSSEGDRLKVDISKTTTELKKFEELIPITTEFETELHRYISNCAKEREYLVNIQTINAILDDSNNINIINGVLNGSIQCESPSLQTITSSTKIIYENYSKIRTYTDTLTATYNNSALKLTESEEIISELSKDNAELGVETQKIMQDLKFLKSKKITESQEIAILLRNVSEDYQALTTLKTENFYGAKSQTNKGDKLISLSLDEKNTWYSFQDQEEFFQFLKLLNNSNAEVRLIQDKTLDIIEKKNSIVKINASEISKIFMIDLISQDISKNNSQISALNNEQNEIKPKIDQYSAYVKQLRETDTILRKNIASMTAALDQCKEYSIEEISALASKKEKLNDDLKAEMKRLYLLEFSDKDFAVIENPDSAVNLDVADLLLIVDNYSKFESRFTNCKQSDRLDIITNSVTKDSTLVNGISNFSVSTDPGNTLSQIMDSINTSYTKSQPIDQIDINHYSNFINKNLIENRNKYLSIENSTFVLNLIPNYVWSQEIQTIEENHNIYVCNNSNWEEVSENKTLVLKHGECKSLSPDPVILQYSPEKEKPEKLISTEINKFILNNQIKVKGECKTF